MIGTGAIILIKCAACYSSTFVFAYNFFLIAISINGDGPTWVVVSFTEQHSFVTFTANTIK